MGLLPTQEKIEVVAAQTLAGASAVINSAAVPCLGALEVYFFAFATNAIATSAAVYEYSLDNGATWKAAQAAYFDSQNTIGASPLQGGALLFVAPRSVVTPALSRMICTHVRLKTTGNVGASPANDILNFRVDAITISAA